MLLPKHVLAGAIVSPVEYDLPFGFVIRVADDGRFVIPCSKRSAQTTLQMYDPRTGMYDANVLSFTFPFENYGRLTLFHPPLFMPDTSTFYLPLTMENQLSIQLVQVKHASSTR